MSPTPISVHLVEVLEDEALTVQDIAHGVRMEPEWVITHVEAGVFQPCAGQVTAEWRFASTTLRRARRIAQLEHSFDADPQLAALAADLMEEVADLRQRLRAPAP
ncbi:chaperone modulator CbpM [Ottowia thiooxydans]|uniref:chaperone modulator CbpM n=1 Tax=Ottowia thiooxydans TaxID=219182 RepID=UPI00041E7DFD|nr:chaperone modulator CbpM [Ottowia thiooxydans]